MLNDLVRPLFTLPNPASRTDYQLGELRSATFGSRRSTFRSGSGRVPQALVRTTSPRR